jgi:hypothetical protein
MRNHANGHNNNTESEAKAVVITCVMPVQP